MPEDGRINDDECDYMGMRSTRRRSNSVMRTVAQLVSIYARFDRAYIVMFCTEY